jgi:glucose-6-phosphate 1-epimerase
MQSFMTIQELNERFAIPGVAQIVAGHGNLPKIEITTPLAKAEIYLQGAHLTSWHPADTEEVIFLSEHALWEKGRAIRGGIPLCFPWFRGKADNAKAPAHGFVRTKTWQICSIVQEENSVTVTLETESDEDSKKWWPHEFHLRYRITVGLELRLELIVTNTGSNSLHFEEALHTYHKVGDVEKVQISGLDQTAFLDNTDANREKLQHKDVVISGPVDNAYLNTQNALELIDPVLLRRVRIEKGNSFTTVVWNPGKKGAEALADLGNEEWRQMACVEACNILSFAVELSPGSQHSMTANIQVITAEDYI